MAISKKIEAAINKQINHDLMAAYSYLAISAWFEEQNLAGFGKWFLMQRTEELEHAQRLFQYLLDRGGRIALDALPKPKATFATALAAFKASFELEKANTRTIHALYQVAKAEDDFATLSHLQWFLDEQVEEEKIMSESIALLELAGKDSSALLMLNEKFGSRGPKSE
jgi:ferritin